MIKVSDFIFQHLVNKYNIHHCFMVSGGGAMHLDDSIGHTEGLSYICNHHEQACAIAQEGYYRASDEMAVTCVTSGPGGTNTLTGVLGQWLDSIPALYLSGQIKRVTHLSSCPELNLRQLGDQEADIISMVMPITKYAETVMDPLDIKYHLDKAMYLAMNGRMGPSWLDIPLDIQGAMIDEAQLKEFDPSELSDEIDYSNLNTQIEHLISRIATAKSPVIFAGTGIRLAKQVESFMQLAEALGIPVVTTVNASDIIPYNHPLCYGKCGIKGNRLGNIIVQNADLLIVLGNRLSIRQVSYAYDKFATRAYKVMVDVDADEMRKPTISIDYPIHADLAQFIPVMTKAISTQTLPDFSAWRQWGREIEGKIPTIFQDNNIVTEGYVDSHIFIDELFKKLSKGDMVVAGVGTSYTPSFQEMNVQAGVRVFANQGCASMGYDLPAVIGAAISREKVEGNTICITGDGSIQMNLQELQTIVSYNLPIKIFVLENDGYLAIKTTQNAFFKGHLTGANASSGVKCPDMSKIAAAYGIPFVRENDVNNLSETLDKVLSHDGYMICEIKMPPMQTLLPKPSSYMDENGKMTSAPLEKMAPFMSEELQEECIYKA